MEQIREELTALASQYPDGRASYGPAFFVVAYAEAPLMVGDQNLCRVAFKELFFAAAGFTVKVTLRGGPRTAPTKNFMIGGDQKRP
jgi:hypothetical protein